MTGDVLRPDGIWHRQAAGMVLQGRGNPHMLERPLNGFFASRACPARVLRAAMDWALAQAQAGAAVVGGFHSPLEQSVLRVLLEAATPVVIVLARPVAGARLSADWQSGLQHGALVVVTAIGHTENEVRLTARAAQRRNEVVARLARRIVVAHAAPNGQLASQVAVWRAQGRTLDFLPLS